jgi:hypothetical protein
VRIPGAFSAELTSEGLLAWHGDDELMLATTGYGAARLGGAEPSEGDCALGNERVGVRCVRQVELAHGDVTEWWVSRDGGLEHGWTLYGPALGDVEILEIELRTGEVLSVDADGSGATLSGSTGELWRYEDLVAWDADGRSVEARLESSGLGLSIRIESAGARWPVVVDPVLTLLTDVEDRLTASDGDSGDYLGYSVSGAGDLDGDGYGDLVVGVFGDDDDGGNSGSAYVFYGTASGIDSAREDKLTASDGDNGDSFGYSVSGAGDLDGDGYDDLVVGASGDEENGTSSGSAYVYYGSASGIDSEREDKLTASDGDSHDGFGLSVSGAGDLDGDGYDDLVVGAAYDEENGSASGSAYVYYGSATGIDSAREDKLTASDGDISDQFSFSVSGAGDLDGDGYDDLVVGAYLDSDNGTSSGSAYVYYGSGSGIDSASEDKLTASDGDGSDFFGRSVSGAGDLDGDGYDDLVVGAFWDEENGTGSGSAYVYYGSGSGIDSAREGKLTASDGDSNDHFGLSVSGAGDLDGDGYDDLLVGAYGDQDNGISSGSVYVYYGSGSGIDSASEGKFTASDGAFFDFLGWSVSGAGDLDGDGYDDLVVGAYGDEDNGGDSGSAYVFYGACTDRDEDGFCLEDDCDDTDANVNPTETEVCGDGIDNDCDGNGGPETDDDGDGLTWSEEDALGTDDCNDDSDGDGLKDAAEVLFIGSDPLNADTDGDLLTDGNEVNFWGTSPILVDTDGDLLTDGEEVLDYGTDPTLTDTDGDTLSDGTEVLVTGTDPNARDTDGDRLGDGYEVNVSGTNPLLVDSDSDGLWDSREINSLGTDPLNDDSDSDGYKDGYEVKFLGSDPLDGSDPGL